MAANVRRAGQTPTSALNHDGACHEEIHIKLDWRIGMTSAIFGKSGSFAIMARFSGPSSIEVTITTPRTPKYVTGRALATRLLLLSLSGIVSTSAVCSLAVQHRRAAIWRSGLRSHLNICGLVIVTIPEKQTLSRSCTPRNDCGYRSRKPLFCAESLRCAAFLYMLFL